MEIITLVQGSEEWIGNPNYDPFCATASTRFFVSHNYTKDEVANYAATLEAKLKSYEIEIDDMPYPATSPRGVNSEQRYYDLIVERYINYYKYTSFLLHNCVSCARWKTSRCPESDLKRSA